MKNVLFWAIFAATATMTFAQSDKRDSTTSNTVVHTVDFTVDNLDELEDMDWDDLFVVFRRNKPLDSMRVGVTLKEYTATNANGVELTVPLMKISVSGLSRDREQLKERLKARVDRMAAKLRNFSN